MSDIDIETGLEAGVRQFQARTSADYERLSGGGYTSLAHRRAVAEQVREPWRSGGPAMAATETLAVGPLQTRVRIHRPLPGTEPLPVLVYLHGGGWTLFSIDTHDRLMREYAARSGCAVVGVDYSLSPEVRFPRALDEVTAVVGWIRAVGVTHGLDPARVAIGGDSAGGNLSLGAALRLRDDGAGVDGVLLNYAALDTVERPSYARFGGDEYMLGVGEMRDFWDNYLGAERSAHDDPHARPMLADLAGLPPVHMCIAGCDILLDENQAMAERLRAAGVSVSAVVYPGATHSFLEAVEVSPLADRAMAEASAWLAATLAR